MPPAHTQTGRSVASPSRWCFFMKSGEKVKKIHLTEDEHECDAIKCGINMWFHLSHYHTPFDMWIFKRLQTCDQLLKHPLERKKERFDADKSHQCTCLNECWCFFLSLLEMLKEFMPRWSKAVWVPNSMVFHVDSIISLKAACFNHEAFLYEVSLK